NDLHDPMVQVKVHRVVPTMFIAALSRMLGGNPSGITVAAKGTAEAYNPTGSNTPFATGCIKPWMMPNCDPNPLHATPANANCGAGGGGYFVRNSQLVNPGYYQNGGAVGESSALHMGRAPRQYGAISFTGSSRRGHVN